jgi:hypothetical protein
VCGGDSQLGGVGTVQHGAHVKVSATKIHRDKYFSNEMNHLREKDSDSDFDGLLLTYMTIDGHCNMKTKQCKLTSKTI